MNEPMSLPRAGSRVLQDPEMPAVHEQLIVFAREIGELYRLERARSAELEQVLASLQETYLATMKGLAQVIEAKDQTTRGHLERAQSYGVALARRIDPSLVETPTLGYGFFLHDIGKVGVPEHILCKDGPLDDAEWSIMRMHPVIGAQIVAPLSFLNGAVDLIRHHHERFDGTGYPDGLHGEAIPLGARVFSVVDSFDAMTSDRPYRGSMEVERALDEVRAGASTQFDPEVVGIFAEMIEQAGGEGEVAELLRQTG